MRVTTPGGTATSATDFTVPPYVLWSGFDWWPSAPTASTHAVLREDYHAGTHGNFEAASLWVTGAATLRIPQGRTITVNGELNYNGRISVESGGALVQTTGSTVGNNITGAFRADQQGWAGPTLAYNFWSSPVQSFPVRDLGGPAQWRYLYDESLAPRWRTAQAGDADFMEIGRGYTAVNAGSLTFRGTPNNGTIARPGLGRTETSPFAGFHLVGNPYPSALTITGPGGLLDPADNPGLEQQAWVYLDDRLGFGGGQYQTVNQLLNGNQVAVAQGFFVRTTVAGNTLTFRNRHRSGGSPTFFRPEGGHERFALDVAAPGGATDRLHLAFSPAFTDGHDAGLDGHKMDGPSPVGLSALAGGEKYEVLALPENRGGRLEIPLALNTRRAGAHTFSSPQVESPTAQKLFLEDRQSGEFYYLQPGRSHTLNLPAGNHRDRFFLRSASEVAGQSTQLGETAGAFAFGRELFVEAGETAEVAVYSTLGTLVQRFANVPAGGLRRLDAQVPASGVYVVKVATATGSVEKRVWLEK